MVPQPQLAARSADSVESFEKRDDFCDGGWYWDGNDCTRSGWDWWGRWVLLGIVIIGAFLVFLSFCVVARRRRRLGTAPVYGTGWMAPQDAGPYRGDQQNYQGYNQGYEMNNQNKYGQQSGVQQEYPVYGGAPPPPAYGQQQQREQQAQYTGSTFNPADGYYGQQSPQNPPHAYQQGQSYAPPAGPPPGK